MISGRDRRRCFTMRMARRIAAASSKDVPPNFITTGCTAAGPDCAGCCSAASLITDSPFFEVPPPSICSGAVPAAVVPASRRNRGRDALGTAGRMPALHSSAPEIKNPPPFRFWRWVSTCFELWTSSAGDLRQKTCNSLSLGYCSRLRHSHLWHHLGHGLLIVDLFVEVAGGLVSTSPFHPIFKDLTQPVDQPLLPAYDVEAT